MLKFRPYRLKCNALDYQGCEDSLSGNKVVHANISDEKIKEDYIKLIYDFINLKSES